ncbi:MAG: type II secretory pathway component GspD/PulD (secretin), partial [Mariniblastus sp.]
TVLRTIYTVNQATVDANSRTIIATVAKTDHDKIQTIIEQLKASRSSEPITTKVFRVTNASPTVVSTVIQSLLPLAKLSSDTSTKSIIITATESELASAAELITQIDGSGKDQITEVYRLISASPASVMPAILARLPGATITSDDSTRSIFVTADPDAQQVAATLIDKFNGVSEGQSTEVYTLLYADVNAVRPALETLVVNGKIVSDTASNSIIVIASPADHASVAELVKKLDHSSGNTPVLKLYHSKFDNYESLFGTMQSAFRSDPTIQMTYDWQLKRITVIAPENKHQLISELIDQVDSPIPMMMLRIPKVYSIGNIDGRAAEGTVRDMIQGMDPRVEIRLERSSNSLIVVATAEQHPLIAKTIQEIDRDLKKLEVFQLFNVDPYTIELVVADLFSALPPDMMPTATSDVDSQQLFVRGSESQIEQVRALLQKMGERFDQGIQVSKGAVRTIPFKGNAMDAIREIEAIWPRVRKNRIQIIRPSGPEIRRDLEPLKIREDDQNKRRRPQTQPDSRFENLPNRPQQDESRAGAFEIDPVAMNGILFSPVSLISAPALNTQDETIPAPQKTVSQDSAVQNPDNPQIPDIVVIPGDHQLTIASSDLAALDQLELFLRTIGRRRGGMASSNFAVFLLTNSSAPDIAKLLSNLFRGIPAVERAGSVGDAIFVADERLNALVVYGSRKEREVIEEIVEVLDANDLPDSLTTSAPELVVVENADAKRILVILQDVYQTQLTNGGGRRPVDIPEGVPIAVAAVLQQINVSTAGPILTLGIDATANSIVMRAPVELGLEIRDFVAKLDQNSVDVPTRNIRVIRLEGTNTDRVQQFLRGVHSSNN